MQSYAISMASFPRVNSNGGIGSGGVSQHTKLESVASAVVKAADKVGGPDGLGGGGGGGVGWGEGLAVDCRLPAEARLRRPA